MYTLKLDMNTECYIRDHCFVKSGAHKFNWHWSQIYSKYIYFDPFHDNPL